MFGVLIFPTAIFESYMYPLISIANLSAGLVFLHQKKKLIWFMTFLIFLVICLNLTSSRIENLGMHFHFAHMGTYFLFYSIITYIIIIQVWQAKKVNKNVIYGLIAGYLSLGLIGFFICLGVEMAIPGSFAGIDRGEMTNSTFTETMMYFSYVTLLTIGYGDIYPHTLTAKKASILIGLAGQFYMVIITAIVVGKYLSQNMEMEESKS